MSEMIKKQAENLAQPKPQKTMQDLVQRMQPEIAKALPSVITPERFTRMVLSALSTNPQLAQCTPKSFLGSMMTAAQLGVEPNSGLGQAYILPYKNKGVLECQFQLSYKGLIDLCYRSGEVSLIQAHIVCENDEFVCQYGLNPDLKHVPAKTNRGKMIAVYAVFQTKSGGYGFEVMSVEDIQKHAQKYSKAYESNYSPWKTNFEEMAKKTVLKRVLKYAPMKTEFVKQTLQDETIKTKLEDDMFNAPDETIYEAEVVGEDVVVDESTGEIING